MEFGHAHLAPKPVADESPEYGAGELCSTKAGGLQRSINNCGGQDEQAPKLLVQP